MTLFFCFLNFWQLPVFADARHWRRGEPCPRMTHISFTQSYAHRFQDEFHESDYHSHPSCLQYWLEGDSYLSLSPAAASANILPTHPDYSWGGCWPPLNTALLTALVQQFTLLVTAIHVVLKFLVLGRMIWKYWRKRASKRPRICLIWILMIWSIRFLFCVCIDVSQIEMVAHTLPWCVYDDIEMFESRNFILRPCKYSTNWMIYAIFMVQGRVIAPFSVGSLCSFLQYLPSYCRSQASFV